MKRRRMFDIELPEPQSEAEADGGGSTAVAADARFTAVNPAPRRGPMAAAVRETAASLGARGAAEAAIRAENDALAHAHVAARAAGLVLERVPLDRIDATRLERDRRTDGPDPELDELIESLRWIGLSNPIHVERTGEGESARYELIQGWRRVAAFRALLAETGDPAWATIPARVAAPEPELEFAYRRMVDENLVRKAVSYGEMAALARAYAADPETEVDDAAIAVAHLFSSTSAAKRAHIRAFVDLLNALGGALRFPEAISRDLGLAARRALREGDVAPEDLVRALEARPDRRAEDELTLLRSVARWSEGDGPPDPVYGEDGFTAVKRGRAPSGRVSFQIGIARGAVRVSALDGRIVLRAEADFAGMDRPRLEQAVAAFFRALDG